MVLGATTTAVRQQIAAMGFQLFEVGVFRPEAAGVEASMLLRVWDPSTLLRSVAWLRFQNNNGRHIYIRPKGEHNLRLVDAEGKVYPQAYQFLASIRCRVEERLRERERLRLQTIRVPIGRQMSTIDTFRSDTRYGGDGNRIDLAYAIYALSRGATEDEV